MAIQDTGGNYAAKYAQGAPGMIADASLGDNASRVVENAPVAFGLAVGRGTSDGSCRLGGTGFEGITVADKSRKADRFEVGEPAAVRRKGPIWVTASNDVAPGDPVTFTAATGVIGAGLATTIPNATFETSAAAGALVRVHLA